jgi:hypothetical protein
MTASCEWELFSLEGIRARFVVLTEVLLKVQVLWLVTPCQVSISPTFLRIVVAAFIFRPKQSQKSLFAMPDPEDKGSTIFRNLLTGHYIPENLTL